MKLTVVNNTRSSVSIGGRVGRVKGSGVNSFDLTIAELEALRATLVSLADAQIITWTTTNDLGDDNAEGATIAYVDAAVSGGGGGGIVAPTDISAQTYTLSDDDHGLTFICSGGAGCEVTVPDDVSPGLTATFIQRGLNLTVVGSGTMTISTNASFSAAAAGEGSPLTIFVESATIANVSGDLAAAP